MGRQYERKTSRQSWSKVNLRAAINAVRQGVSIYAASKLYCIPKKTLLRYLRLNSDTGRLVVSKMGRYRTVFTKQQEDELVNDILQMADTGYGLTHRDIRKLAYQKAEKLAIIHPFKRKAEAAGSEWLRCFLDRHPNIVLRKTENTSLARAKGFSKEAVDSFFLLLRRVFSEDHYAPDQIWNVDETGFSTVQNKVCKVFARKGQRQVPGLQSAERGTNTTVIMAMSAAGKFAPPTFVFSRSRITEVFKIGAPTGSQFLCHPSGWSNSTTCSQWFEHFLKFVQPSAKRPMLLILDGHTSHTKNLNFLERASNSFVRIVSIPPHTSHKLQPLDVSVMGPLKASYSKAMDTFMKRNPGKAILVQNVASLVKEAFDESATVKNAMSGFRATGIWPLDDSVFTDEHFVIANKLIEDTEEPNKFIDQNSDPLASPGHGDNVTAVPDKWTVATHECKAEPEISVPVDQSSTPASPKNAAAVDMVFEDVIELRQEMEPTNSSVYELLSFDVGTVGDPIFCDYQSESSAQLLLELPALDEQNVTSNSFFDQPVIIYYEPQLDNLPNPVSIDSTLNEIKIMDITGGDIYTTAQIEYVLEDDVDQHYYEPQLDTVSIDNALSNEIKTMDTTEAPQIEYVFEDDVNQNCLIKMDPNLYYQIDENGRIMEWREEHESLLSNETSTTDSSTIEFPCTDTPIQNTTIIPTTTNSSTRKRKKGCRKSGPEELTSAEYRKKLKTTSATTTIRTIQKKGRKKAARIPQVDDSLCFTCGALFSTSGDGNGWKKCLLCDGWFHDKCSEQNAIICNSCE